MTFIIVCRSTLIRMARLRAVAATIISRYRLSTTLFSLLWQLPARRLASMTSSSVHKSSNSRIQVVTTAMRGFLRKLAAQASTGNVQGSDHNAEPYFLAIFLMFESFPYRSLVDVCDPMLSDAGFWFVPSSARHPINSLKDQPTPR
ncbi:hypothetical protein CTAM01_10014 [Colletotrichum tamarilloi]|uniref:Uncharacterized protein n=1 Tax=Colletotrichum tamarilloi TaxID=1209934 RepID=A0ABQ9R1P1_9PEZI|nr:uncharacterized protein CTAM01_10014 [Colletotrichum tamarilloi]KAK1492220.1 hypothetical protein CTAM01_10014 [Colletotrichum tamarilloi]